MKDRLDDACRPLRLEWLVMPFEETPEAWRTGPFWGALLLEELPPQPDRRRFFRYHGPTADRDGRPQPQVVFICRGPLGRKALKRLLLEELQAASPPPPAAHRGSG